MTGDWTKRVNRTEDWSNRVNRAGERCESYGTAVLDTRLDYRKRFEARLVVLIR